MEVYVVEVATKHLEVVNLADVMNFVEATYVFEMVFWLVIGVTQVAEMAQLVEKEFASSNMVC